MAEQTLADKPPASSMKVYVRLLRYTRPFLGYFALSILGIQDGRTAQEIADMIGFTGARLTDDHARSLTERGIVRRGEPDGRLWLTDAGRRTLIELAAAAKAAEEDALGAFDDNETALLKHLLKHVIRHTDPGLPDPWAADRGAD